MVLCELEALMLKRIILKEDISMGESMDSQVVMMAQLQAVVDQLIGNSIAFEAKIKDIGMLKIKLPLIERFNGIKSKLKGFFALIKQKIYSKGAKLLISRRGCLYRSILNTRTLKVV